MSKWDINSSLKEAKKYKTRGEFHKYSNGAFRFLSRNNNLHLLYEVIPPRYSLEICLNEAVKYGTKFEFQKGSNKHYAWLKRNKELGRLGKALCGKLISRKFILEELYR